MDGEAWRATVHGGHKDLDTTERHTHIHTHICIYTHTHIEERVSGACPWVCGEGHKIPSELLQTQLHWEHKALQQTGCMEFLEAPVMMFKKQISEVFSVLSSGMILALFLLRRDLWEKIEAVLSDRRTMEPCFRWDLKNYRYGTLHS